MQKYISVTPANNMVLKKKWDQNIFDIHRKKVSCFQLAMVPCVVMSYILNFIDTQCKTNDRQSSTCYIWASSN